VANKYLTGFDQPKLCAMYIDKPLDGVLAVQALSRLNRSAPELKKVSEDLFIMDFYNTTDGIKEAFDPFFTETTLAGPTDVNILHQLKTTLLQIGVFDMEEVYEFSALYIQGAEADQWAPILDTAVERFDHEIEWAENGKADFKMKCKQFVRVYSRVAAIIDYEVLDWEKLFWYLRYLIPDLHVDSTGEDIKDLLDNIDLNTYGLRRTALNETIGLDAGEATLNPNKPVMVNAGDDDDDKDPLDKILAEFNERWFKGWEATPEDQKAKLLSISKAVTENEDYQNLVVGNPDQQAVDDLMAKIIDGIIRQKRKGDMSLYKEYQQNEGFKVNFRDLIVRMVSDTTGALALQLRRLHRVEDDNEVRELVYNRMLMDREISNYELQREIMEKFGERYGGMKPRDWEHIISDYTQKVRNSKDSDGTIIINSDAMDTSVVADPLLPPKED
jgi:type I restriction enzyme R subunit